jgi:PKD repeat protein
MSSRFKILSTFAVITMVPIAAFAANTVAPSTPSSRPTAIVDPMRCVSIGRNLSLGDSGKDVTILQTSLIARGYLHIPIATGYFGSMTRTAVQSWQTDVGVAFLGSAGWGRVGPLSRAEIMRGCDSSRSNFSASPARGAAPLTVQFAYQPSEENGQYYIDFGDGNGQLMGTTQIYCIRAPCISPAVATHTYTAAGNYTASVSRYIACLYSNPRCMIAQPAPYAQINISVSNGDSGASPVISGLSGPTHLRVNEEGTWRITASDPQNGELTYSLNWNDVDSLYRALKAAAPLEAFMQNTTFTHTYAQAGTYQIAITVRNALGATAQTSTTVQVDPPNCTDEYAPVCGRPTGCMNTCTSGTYCSMLCRLPDPVTYSNSCQLENAHATDLHAGACTGAETI